MWIALPLFSFIFAILIYRVKFPAVGWRMAYLLAAVTLMFLAAAFLEAASLFSAISVFSVRAFWLGVTVSLSGVCVWLMKKDHLRFDDLPGISLLEWAWLLGLGALVFISAFVAFIAPPNNWDSMTYHLPRVFHWAANGSVFYYPSYISRQVFYPPGAEYCLLHAHLLSGDDQWFCFLQWFSYIGCMLATSLIAKFLGARRYGQMAAAVFMATLPMAVLQSTTTQNDLLVSFLLASFIAFSLFLRIEFLWPVVYAAAVALGLAALVKGTFLVILFFAVWFLIVVFKRDMKHVVMAACIVLVVGGLHYFRAVAWQNGKAVFKQEQLSLMMGRKDPAALGANALCQFGSEALLPFFAVNQAIEKFVNGGVGLLGCDVQKDKLFGFSFSGLLGPKFVFDEDYAPNPYHFFLLALLPFALWLIRFKKNVWLYYVCALLGWFVFIGTIRWQPWITRLHLPLFIISAPLIGLVFDRWRWVFVFIGGFLLVMALMTLVHSTTRPLVGPYKLMQTDRRGYYFLKTPESAGIYMRAAAVINASQCRDVGLLLGGDTWEYPLWALTGYGQVKFRSIGLGGKEAGRSPCLAVRLDASVDKLWCADGQCFVKVWEESPIGIFVPVGGRTK